jgi:hypothetical protein
MYLGIFSTNTDFAHSLSFNTIGFGVYIVQLGLFLEHNRSGWTRYLVTVANKHVSTVLNQSATVEVLVDTVSSTVIRAKRL